MRIVVSILICLFSVCCYSQPPCAQDSAVDHTPITVEMDTIAPPCYPFRCNPIPDSCHVIGFRDSLSGVFELSNADERFEIIVLDRCRWVVFDTCATVHSTTPGFVLFRTFPPMSTVLVCGGGNSQLQVTVKHVPTASFPPFGPPILDIDTLCGALISIDETQQPESAYYYQESEIRQAGLAGKQPIPVKGHERLPNVGYVKAGRIYGHGEYE